MNKQLLLYAFIALLTTEISSCTTVRVRTNAAQSDALVCKECHGKLNRWFWGYVYNGEFKVEDKDCPSRALQQVQIKTNFLQGVVTVLTLGIYCPVEVNWSCAKEQ